MGSRKVKILFSFMLALVAGCRESAIEKANYEEGVVARTSKDFLIPRDLKAHIESEYLAFIRKENPKIVLPDEEILGRIPREFLDVHAYFRNSHPDVLTSNTVFKLPRGGGEIDLASYVKGTKGSFYLKFQLARATVDGKNTDVFYPRIFFVSETKAKTIDGDLWGLGCRKFADVTDTFLRNENENGFQLNLTAGRYLHVIGGTFYFVDFDPSRKIYLSALRVRNSKQSEQFCGMDGNLE